jgi:WD40 repeat protein
VSSLTFSSDGQLLATGGFDGIVQIWDASSGNLKCVLEGPDEGIEVNLLTEFTCIDLFCFMSESGYQLCGFSVGQMASKRASGVGWFRGQNCLDVEC